MSLGLSPFIAALPLPHHLFFEYDESGDAIMIDATTGEHLTYGRERRESVSTLVASPIAASPPSPPAAPARLRAPLSLVDYEDEEHGSPVRNLAEAMAEAVLMGEPRDAPPIAPPAGEPQAQAQAEGEPQAYGEPQAQAEGEDQGWCVSVTVSDLALSLDMRHPRVLLNLLRFVDSYNELAPVGEQIRLPLIPQERADFILQHESIVNPPAEFAGEVAELRQLVRYYTDDEPVYDDDDGYSTDSEERRDMYRRDSF